MAINRFRMELKENKAGILGGASVGAIAAYMVVQQGIDLTFAAAGGLVSRALPAASASTIGTIKLFIVYIVLGGIIGYIIDKYLIK